MASCNEPIASKPFFFESRFPLLQMQNSKKREYKEIVAMKKNYILLLYGKHCNNLESLIGFLEEKNYYRPESGQEVYIFFFLKKDFSCRVHLQNAPLHFSHCSIEEVLQIQAYFC